MWLKKMEKKDKKTNDKKINEESISKQEEKEELNTGTKEKKMVTQAMVSSYNVSKETLEVLKYFDSTFISKIPESFLRAMKDLASKAIVEVKIDTTKSLKEQNISDDCKDMIALIYYNYVATKPERLEMTEIWQNNEKVYQKALYEKYNPDNVFENTIEERLANNNNTPQPENLPTVVEEKSFIQKIISFIKNIFKKEKV